MVAGGDKPDAGFMGWKDWVIPDGPIKKVERTPHPTKDGSFDSQDVLTKNLPDALATPLDSFNPVRYPKLEPGWTLYKQYGVMTPFTTGLSKMCGGIMTGAGRRCEAFELQAMECLEYYGLKQGMEACKDWYDDLMECRYMTKQQLRVKHMYSKRNIDHRLEYIQGKRDKIFEPPPKFHAYLEPHMKPEHIYGVGTAS